MKDLGTKRLETDRLILRKIELDDYKSAYKNWCSDPASGRVMEKAGMEYVCLIPKWMKNKEDKREDIKYYMILKDSN